MAKKQYAALADILRQAIWRTLSANAKTAVAFSGGLDSSTIATVTGEKTKVCLISMGVAGSPDLVVAKEVAKALKRPLDTVILTPAQMVEDFNTCYKLMPGSIVDLELMIGVMVCAREAKRKGCTVLLMGSGAEELFIGYSKYYQAHEKGMDLKAILAEELRTLPNRDLARTRAVCSLFDVEPRFPFLDEELISAVTKLTIEERLDDGVAKKPVLREMAAALGVPKMAVERPKKAMQYGSHLHIMMRKLMREGRVPKLEVRVAEWMKGMKQERRTD